MTIGSEIAAALPELRAMAESRMTDTCKITVPDPDADPTWNSTTGQYEQASATLYSGKCRIKAPALVNAFQSNGTVETWQVEESVLSIPADAPDIPAGAMVAYLTSAYNASLPGRQFGVVGPHHESQATAQRLVVKEIVGTGGGQ